MEVEIHLKKTLTGGRVWVLCSGNLADYLSELAPDFFNFDVQRKIVENRFLNSLYSSIESETPMPAITLTNSDEYQDNLHSIDLQYCYILDGLQRTFRLWALWYIYRFAKQHGIIEYKEIYDLLKSDELGEKILNSNVINRSKLRELYSVKDGATQIQRLIEKFESYTIVFNIWYNLSEEEIVRQMLILNAGQKSVSSTHQFELIYLRYFEKNILILPENVRILREKDLDFRKIKTIEREVGMYQLSTLMIAFQSYFSCKPLRVKPVNQINYNDSAIVSNFADGLIALALSNFIKCVYELDVKISAIDAYAKVWIAKDTTLSGIFAAIGQLTDPDTSYYDFSNANEYIQKLNIEDLNLDGFKHAYNALSSVNVNVGNAVRKAIYNAFCEYFPGNKIHWEFAFKLS